MPSNRNNFINFIQWKFLFIQGLLRTLRLFRNNAPGPRDKRTVPHGIYAFVHLLLSKLGLVFPVLVGHG